MKFLLSGVLFCSQMLYSQTYSSTYLQELGWTLKIPPSFDGPFPNYKLPHGDSMKRLLGVTKGRDASFVVKIDTAAVFTPLNWEKQDSMVTDGTFEVVERSAPYKLDTTNTIIRYDGVVFKKRVGKETITRDEFWYIVSLRSFYKDHYFTVSYTYKHESSGSEIETMLSTSRFEK